MKAEMLVLRLIAFAIVSVIGAYFFFHINEIYGIGIFLGTLVATTHGLIYDFGYKRGSKFKVNSGITVEVLKTK
ncbi:MAG: hypothetical protein NTW30_05935 [Candidatus Aenigmarchaeota archaeon]|nr:hypothetical protein [Candidatus Aenigmarchaeota archaeon]